jgi:hypothetical protein
VAYNFEKRIGPMVSPTISAEKMNRAVVAFLDGRRLKGYLFNFSALQESFRLFPNETQQKAGTDILMKDLKAIFLLRILQGIRITRKPPATMSPSMAARS